MGGQTYSIGTDYDLTGQVSRLTYPDGTEVDRTYSERGQLATIAFNGTTIDTRTYDDGGRMLTSSYNNGVSESRTYNIDNTLASINFAGAPIGNLTYGWDANKNKTTETIAGTMSGYGFDATTYDHEDRLVSWNRTDNALDQSWNLSLVGDWNSVTENTSVQVRTHGPTHELLTAAGAAVQHDAKGNQTLIPPALRPTPSGLTPTASRLRWDFENKLIAADTNNDRTDDVFYKWDALGRRVGRIAGSSSTVYVQDGQQTIADYTLGTAATTPTYNYVYASYIDEPVMRTGSGNSIYFHRNQQYSITALTNGSGTITERYAYTAYGTPTITDASGTPRTSSADTNRYTFTGREYDEAIRLYHYRARMYDSEASRFCSRDPIGYLDGENFYQNYFILTTADPSGLCKSTCQPPTSDDDCTNGGGTFVGRLSENTEDNTIGSDIELVFLANPASFKDSGGSCCCDEVGFIQVANHRFSYGGYFGDHPDGPYIDNGGRPNYPIWPWENEFYPHGDDEGKPSSGTVCSGSVISAPSLGDRPFVQDTWMLLGLHPLQYVEQAFEVCAVCKSGNEAGRIYGCISWGYRAQRMPDGTYQYERWAGGKNARGDESVGVSFSSSGGCPSQTWRELVQ